MMACRFSWSSGCRDLKSCLKLKQSTQSLAQEQQ